VELSDPAVEATRQPFHDGFGTAQANQAEIARLVKMIQRRARQSIDALLRDERFLGRDCCGAALVVGSVIDPATVANPHIRAHANEGRLFRTVVAQALEAREIHCAVVVEKKLGAESARALRFNEAGIASTVQRFGRTLGSPWRVEEKAAATAAWMALA
jgi:hypothetical protein